MILERQEEEKDHAVTVAELTTRAILAQVAGAAGWGHGVRQANTWGLKPRPPELPQMSDVVGGLGDDEGALAFSWEEIEALAAEIREQDGDAA